MSFETFGINLFTSSTLSSSGISSGQDRSGLSAGGGKRFSSGNSKAAEREVVPPKTEKQQVAKKAKKVKKLTRREKRKIAQEAEALKEAQYQAKVAKRTAELAKNAKLAAKRAKEGFRHLSVII
jgi:hypothetical protein